MLSFGVTLIPKSLYYIFFLSKYFFPIFFTPYVSPEKSNLITLSFFSYLILTKLFFILNGKIDDEIELNKKTNTNHSLLGRMPCYLIFCLLCKKYDRKIIN